MLMLKAEKKVPVSKCWTVQKSTASEQSASVQTARGKGEEEDACLKLAKSYDFEKDLGTAYAVKEVWRMSRQDYKYYMIGVGFTFLGSWLAAPLCFLHVPATAATSPYKKRSWRTFRELHAFVLQLLPVG